MSSTTFRRCAKCGGRFAPKAKRCDKCGHDKFSWAFVVDVGPVGGPREQKRRGGFRTQKEASEAMQDLLVAVRGGEYVRPSRLTVEQYLKDWLTAAKTRLRPGAYDSCELHVRVYITPRIGSVPLQGLTATKIKALYADLLSDGRVRGEGGLSAKTVYNVHRTLHHALGDAVADRTLGRNPAVGLFSEPESPEMPTWTAEEVRKFFDHVADHRLAAMWRLIATTGIRRGELVGLRWRDIDWEHGRITLVQQRAKGGGTVESGPVKTKRSRRLVSLDPVTVAALKAHRKRQAAERLELKGNWPDHELVFCLEDGSPLHPDTVTSRLRRITRDLKLPWIRVHGLRHTHATLMLQAGVHPKVVQERLGHSSIAITLDIYSHAIPEMQEDAALRAAAIIDGTA